MKWQRAERRSAAPAIRSNRGRGAATVAVPPTVQPLETRVLFSVGLTLEGLYNASKFPASQSDPVVAINRTNPANVFIAAFEGFLNEPNQGAETPVPDDGIFTAFTTNAGDTWTPTVVGPGNGLPLGSGDPSAAFDEFGNLYFAYTTSGNTALLLSTDGGATFATHGPLLPGFNPDISTALLPNGTVSVSVSYTTGDSIRQVGATATGLGAVGLFTLENILPQSGLGNGANNPHDYSSTSVGPDGQVAVAHQEIFGAVNQINVNFDPDGLGPAAFSNAFLVDVSQLTAQEPLPGQFIRGAATAPSIAYDRSSGPHRGRLYIAYAQAITEERLDELLIPISTTVDTDVYLRFSDDNGVTWSEVFRVNDDSMSGDNSQFHQRLSVDPVTGKVAIGWLDSRDDTGGGESDNELHYYMTVGEPLGNGMLFAPNARLSFAASNARLAANGFEDYGGATGLDFYNNVVYGVYPDNTNTLGNDNPSGRHRAFDIYAGRVRVTDTTVPTPPFVTPASPLAPTVIKPVNVVKKGRFYQLRVNYSHPSGINLGTVSGDDILVTGPNGFSQTMQLTKVKPQKKGTVAAATYRLPAPGGTWDSTENGLYTATLQGGVVTSTDATTTTTAGMLTRFTVDAKAARAGGAGRLLAPGVVSRTVAPGTFSDASLLSDSKEDDSLDLLS